MTTQDSQGGKGKKKNKENKMSLEEFNNIETPHGHSVVNLKVQSFDWAACMADHENDRSAETQQVIVPAAPRAQRGPTVDINSLPDEPPFKISVFNLPLSADEKELTDRIFRGLEVKSVDIGKSVTTVELGSKNDLWDALSKDGISVKGKTIDVCLFGQSPPNRYGSDRYGGRGGGNSYGDRYSDRTHGSGFGRSRTDDRYGDRSGGGGFGRDRNNYSSERAGGGFGAGRPGGYNSPRGGYGSDRYGERGNFRDNNRGSYTSGGGEPSSEESNDWRARPNIVRQSPPAPAFGSGGGSRPAYQAPRYDSSQQQPHHQQPHHYQASSSHHSQYQNHDTYNPPRHQQHHNYNHQSHIHNQSSNHSPYPDYSSQNTPRPAPPTSTAEERPKLVLHKRKAPINVDDVSTVSRNEAIFGAAKPSSKPYEKMKEIEEKLSAVQVSSKKDGSDSRTSASPTSAPNSDQQSVPPRSKNVSESSQHENSSRPVQS